MLSSESCTLPCQTHVHVCMHSGQVGFLPSSDFDRKCQQQDLDFKNTVTFVQSAVTPVRQDNLMSFSRVLCRVLQGAHDIYYSRHTNCRNQKCYLRCGTGLYETWEGCGIKKEEACKTVATPVAQKRRHLSNARAKQSFFVENDGGRVCFFDVVFFSAGDRFFILLVHLFPHRNVCKSKVALLAT